VLAEGDLFAVACPKANLCVAVGSNSVSFGISTTLAQIWNGTAWTLQQLPSLPPATQSGLTGVSCRSANACIAVGSYRNSAGKSFTLAEVWNGIEWTLSSPPNPASAKDSYLNGISCTSTSCTAVGDYQKGAGTATFPLVEQWNGGTWTEHLPGTPPGAVSSLLDGVSCTSATVCVAVGSYQKSSGPTFTLAEVRSGNTWSVQPSHNLPGSNALTAVSCSSANSCTAAGYNFLHPRQIALAEILSGNQWVIQLHSSPPGDNDFLRGVSCSSAASCSAIGDEVGASVGSVQGALALVRSGSTWLRRLPANPSGDYGVNLRGVSCTSASFCIAVGEYGVDVDADLTLTEAWNSKTDKWTILPPANPASVKRADYILIGDSCLTTTMCAAVGADEYTGVPLAEFQHDTTWAPVPAVQPAHASIGLLNAVSCPSVDGAGSLNCMAVGFYQNSSGTSFTLAEMWSANTWTITATPLPSGATSGYLFGVSCSSSTSCTAVGYYTNSSGMDVALAEVWDGHTWTIQTIPNPTGVSWQAVSCSSANSCTAVGYYTSSGASYFAVVGVQSGTTWSLHFPPTPPSALDSSLTSVSCSSASACTAVGYYVNGSGKATLADVGSGNTWSIQPTPNLSAVAGNVLEGDSCSSASACTAVGNYTNNSGMDGALAQVQSGSTWSIQPTPNPSGAEFSDLTGVSCAAATVCTAVGGWGSSGGTQALVEAEGS
jgi:hypothetical protein